VAREELLSLYERAIAYGKRRGLGDSAYDFAGFAAEQWLKGKSQHQLLEHTFIDFCRSPRGLARSEKSTDALAYSRPLTGLFKEPTSHWRPPVCVDFAALCTTKKDRETLKLLLEGFSQKDIADTLGVTEGAITHRMKALIKKMRVALGINIDEEPELP
jgi:DNA-directed RNA polymerase specialized sigma24 family protein